ncbi:DUF4407 domain-containing protein [Dactylosporangium sp. NBC_01737]|uniref:DUF4407 domain-containing protein n=1 Tax=Dactylosporangium sp. NBC_01737 TaxID=2975959 RepID=UPI002E0DAD2F|nr:DUF4407 domain-containing protein [Dactylosporangium sp. NBC_01737]
MTRASVGTLLAQLGGAYPKYVHLAPSAKGRFIQMGLVLLSTGGLAVVSMSFALSDGLKASWWISVPLGLLWGFIILNLDRMLIQNMRLDVGVRRAIMMIVPRLIIAALLGIVIATPLVLRVFHDEIMTEMHEHNVQETVILGDARNNTPQVKELADLNAKIARDDAILAGDVPDLKSANVDAARSNLTAAQTNLDAKRKVSAELYDQMRCELDGERCSGGSGKVGPGPRYEALKRRYQIATADENTAQQAVNTAQAALDDANKNAAASNTAAVAEAQQHARAELPDLIKQRDALQLVVSGQKSGDTNAEANNTGILAQIEALGRIGDKSSSANLAHWAVAGLLFMIELLPVLVKLLTSMGPPTVYDRISELDDNSTLDDASQRRNSERRRIEAESKIENDMIAREQALGIKANAHVAGEMEKILDTALTQWSSQVTNTLTTPPTPTKPSQVAPVRKSGMPTNSSQTPTPVIPTQSGPSSGQNPVRTRFGMPPSSTLGNTP